MNPKIDERIEDEYEAKIKGEFKIYLGNKLYTKGKNTWTALFCESLCAALLPNGDTNNYTADTTLRFASYRMDARVGTDTSTPTEPTMSDLVSKVDTPPDSKVRRLIYSSSEGLYITEFVFSWNAGTLPDMTIGEFGVYLYIVPIIRDGTFENFTNIWYYWVAPGNFPSYGWAIPQLKLAARVSSADGDFDPIDYTSEEALIFEWYVTIKF